MGPYNGVDNILHVGEMWIICVQRSIHLPNLLVNCDAIKYGHILPFLLYKPLCNTTLPFLSSVCEVYFCTSCFWASFGASFDQKKVSEAILRHGLKWHGRFFPLITCKQHAVKKNRMKSHMGRKRLVTGDIPDFPSDISGECGFMKSTEKPPFKPLNHEK